tara:strand:+ start:328 stop:687 length:360 start_codon:yes stop_codon:yes gene_type:complete
MSFENLIVPWKSSLPDDWKPSRGRGRTLQKSKMTTEQINEEKSIMLEKNRLAAKESRIKRKTKIEGMEKKIKELEEIVSSFNNKTLYKNMKKRIDILEEVANNQSQTIMNLVEQKNSRV